MSNLGDRTKYIGASDAPSILGFNPYRTPYDVWLEKTGRILPDNGSNPAADAGNRLEPVILDWFSQQTGGDIERQVETIIDEFGFPLITHLDARIVKTGEPVEAKSSGLFSPLSPAWGPDGTDEVPDYVAIQTQVQLIATGKDLCHIPAFLGGRGFCMFRTSAHEDLQKEIVDRLGNFWINNVQKDTPPDKSRPTLEIAKRIHRVPSKSIELDPALVQNYKAAQEQLKNAEAAKKNAQADILAALGDAEVGEAAEIGLTVTYFEQERAEYTVTVPASKYRVMRIKKSK